MNIAVILAGGTGKRLGADIPKQFIKVFDKPILAYTLDLFQTNPNIDAIEVVCHKDWVDAVNEIKTQYNYEKIEWIVDGGETFQLSTFNGIMHLKNILSPNDIVVISFGVAPMTPQDDINDSIRVCKLHGNAIASKDIDLCTCIKDNEQSSIRSITRETLKGFANPWTFKYGELLSAYEYAIEHDMLNKIEPHTTSLYLALGKRIWFSQCTSQNVKITTKADLNQFKGYLLLQKCNYVNI